MGYFDDKNVLVTGGAGFLGKEVIEEIKKDHTHHIQERYYGSFSRSFTLPTTVDTEKVDATLKDGVLRVVLNKREEVKAKRIEVKGE